MARYTIGRWSDYNTSPAPVFSNRKETEQYVAWLRSARAWVEVIKLEEEND